MEISPLMNLPRDLLELMVNKYLDPVSALRSLQTCKKLNELGDRTKIIYEVLMLRMQVEFQDQIDKLIKCPKCFIILETKKSLQKHLRKHNAKKQIRNCKQLVKKCCSACNGPVTNFTTHRCLIQSNHCFFGMIEHFYPWAENLCRQQNWYRIDPNMNHFCSARCKLCKEIFSVEESKMTDLGDLRDPISKHFGECKMKKEMMEIYHLRGDRTDEEWEEFLISIKGIPNTREILFEKEYLEWVEENNREVFFVQKKYVPLPL